MKKLILFLSILCSAPLSQAMDANKREIPLHAAYRMINQKLSGIQVDTDIKKSVHQEARAALVKHAKNSNRIACGDAESIIKNILYS